MAMVAWAQVEHHEQRRGSHRRRRVRPGTRTVLVRRVWQGEAGNPYVEATVESLALLAALIGLAVLASGPLALATLLSGYPYTAGVIGAVASMLGVWWAYTVRGQAGWIGLASAALGLWVVLQAYKHDAAQ